MQYIYIPTKPGNTQRGDYVMMRVGTKLSRVSQGTLAPSLLQTLRANPFTWREADGSLARIQLTPVLREQQGQYA
jgi:hypothetical protein